MLITPSQKWPWTLDNSSPACGQHMQQDLWLHADSYWAAGTNHVAATRFIQKIGRLYIASIEIWTFFFFFNLYYFIQFILFYNWHSFYRFNLMHDDIHNSLWASDQDSLDECMHGKLEMNTMGIFSITN